MASCGPRPARNLIGYRSHYAWCTQGSFGQSPATSPAATAVVSSTDPGLSVDSLLADSSDAAGSLVGRLRGGRFAFGFLSLSAIGCSCVFVAMPGWHRPRTKTHGALDVKGNGDSVSTYELGQETTASGCGHLTHLGSGRGNPQFRLPAEALAPGAIGCGRRRREP